MGFSMQCKHMKWKGRLGHAHEVSGGELLSQLPRNWGVHAGTVQMHRQWRLTGAHAPLPTHRSRSLLWPLAGQWRIKSGQCVRPPTNRLMEEWKQSALKLLCAAQHSRYCQTGCRCLVAGITAGPALLYHRFCMRSSYKYRNFDSFWQRGTYLLEYQS